MANKKLTAVEWLRENLHLAKDPFTKALELEKERESHFAETLKGSTQFLEKVISEGLIDNNPLLKAFIECQIANNNLTLETYGNKESN